MNPKEANPQKGEIPFSQQIQEELRKRSDVILVSSVTNVVPQERLINLIVAEQIEDRHKVRPEKLIAETVDIYCSPQFGVYDADKLGQLLNNLTLRKPSGGETFTDDRYSFNLWLGTSYFDEEIEEKLILETKTFVKIRQADSPLSPLQLGLGEIGILNIVEKPLMQRTTIHLFPDEISARHMYEYARSPEDWMQRMQPHDQDRDFYERFVRRITVEEVSLLQRGKSIFLNLPPTEPRKKSGRGV